MFRAVISRDDGEPWGPTGMSTEKWLEVPPSYVLLDRLIATQPGVLFAGLTESLPQRDPYPHVIRWRGDDYLEDGHHRAVRAMLLGYTTLRARVLNVFD